MRKNNMKIIITTFTIAIYAIGGYASGYIQPRFTNLNETVYIDEGKILFRVDARHEGEFIVDDGTEIIGSRSFDLCDHITSVIIPDSVTNIMRSAFYCRRSLTNVVFGSGLREISENAFLVCQNLEYIELPDSLETIGASAFGGCTSLKEIKLGSGLRHLGEDAIRHRPSPSKPDFETVITISPSNQLFRVKNGELVRKKEDD